MSRTRFALLFVATVAAAAAAQQAFGPLGGAGPRERTAQRLERHYEDLLDYVGYAPDANVKCRPKRGPRFACELTTKRAGRTYRNSWEVKRGETPSAVWPLGPGSGGSRPTP